MKLIYPLLTIGAVVSEKSQSGPYESGHFYFGNSNNRALFAVDGKSWLRIQPIVEGAVPSYFHFESTMTETDSFRIKEVVSNRYLCIGNGDKAALAKKNNPTKCEWKILSFDDEYYEDKIGIKVMRANSESDAVIPLCLRPYKKFLRLDTCDYTGSEVKIDRHMLPRDENEENSDSQGNNFDKDWMSRFDMPDELQVHSGLDGDKSAFLSFVNGFSYFVNRFPNPGKRLELAELKNLFDYNLYITGNLGVQNEFRGQANEEYIREIIHILKGIIHYLIKTDRMALDIRENNHFKEIEALLSGLEQE